MSAIADRLKQEWHRVAADPTRLAVTLAVVITVVGFAGVLKPLQGHIERSRMLLSEASGLADTITEITEMSQQRSLYLDRLQVPSDLIDWQDYVLQAMFASGCVLVELEPGEVKRKQDFRLIMMEVAVSGSYDKVRDFVDRLERGPRLVRIDEVSITAQREEGVLLRCMIRGLAASRLKKSAQEDAKSDAKGDGKGADAELADDQVDEFENESEDDGEEGTLKQKAERAMKAANERTAALEELSGGA